MILVTGGTGLLGSHLLFELSKVNRPVRALYRSAKKKEAVKQLFDFYSGGTSHNFDSIEWIEGDILDLVSLEDAFLNVDTVYHCAAKVSFKRKDFRRLIHVNRKGTANMVNYALKYGVKKFGYVSSTAAIGGLENEPITETTKWSATKKTSGYAISKYNAEREVWRGNEEGMDVVIINPCVIFGAGDFNESSLTIFKTVKKGLKFFSSGSNAFVDARDVAFCLVQLMEREAVNQRYLCVGHNLSFKDSLGIIAQELNVKPPNICPPKWLARFVARLNELVSKIFGTNPSVTLENVHSAYATMTYSNEKITETLNHSFQLYEDTVKNVVAFERWKNAASAISKN